MAREKRYGNNKTLRRVLRSVCFSRKRDRKTTKTTAVAKCHGFGRRTIFSTEAVLVIISGNSMVFARKSITSTGFYRCCAPGASAPVAVKISLPSKQFLKRALLSTLRSVL